MTAFTIFIQALFVTLYQNNLDYEIRTNIKSPAAGDIYRYDDHFLLVTKDYGELYVFAPLLNGRSDLTIEELLSVLVLSYHRETPSTMERMITAILGGEKPLGYFGFSMDVEIFRQLLNTSLEYVCSVDLDPEKIMEVGGGALVDTESTGAVIERSLKFRLNELQEMKLESLMK